MRKIVAYGIPISAFLSLIALYFVPALVYDGTRFGGGIEPFTLMSNWVFRIRYIPGILLFCTTLMSLLKKPVGTFVFSVSYSLFVILSAASDISGGYKPYYGLIPILVGLVSLMCFSTMGFIIRADNTRNKVLGADEEEIISGKSTKTIGFCIIAMGIVLLGAGLYMLFGVGINYGLEWGGGPAIIGGIIIALCSLFVIVYGYNLQCSEIVVTNRRIYGKAAFSKRVDLPLDSVSALATSAFSGIAVTTSSGAIRFREIKNRDEIYEVINELLRERQQKLNRTLSNQVAKSYSSADELGKFKDLLDKGVITQEEFDAKKKQLLGL